MLIKQIKERLLEVEKGFPKHFAMRQEYTMLTKCLVELEANNEKQRKLHQAFNVLVTLVDLKKYKDAHGKNEIYTEKQPQAWDRAKQTIKDVQVPDEY